MFVNEFNHYPLVTPTLWQMVLLRNAGLVSRKNIAKVLKCSLKIVTNEINRLGLEEICYHSSYEKKSYITIIRNNWQLLPNEQIMTLLGMSKEEFEFELKENDFLAVKLGEKPFCKEVIYSSLNEEEIEKTNKIRNVIKDNYIKDYVSPFHFRYQRFPKCKPNKLTIVYPYSAPFGDALLKSSSIVSENELKAMQNVGINGVWFQGLLSKLSYFPFDGKESEDYLIRLKHLNEFILQAKKYGIGVYLYLNEPRSIKISRIDPRYSYLIGRIEDDEASLCISQKEIQDYLYNATKSLLNYAPDLAGIITITSSENLTHCKHKPGSTCIKCKDYRPYELAVLINNILQKAINDSSSKCQLIANLWGWAPYCDFTNEEVKKGISMLDKNITVLCVSEFGTHQNNKGTYEIGEYSISHGEPCIETINYLSYAKSLHHKIMAKIQVNNSWEMSSVPFIPVYECILNHLQKLNELGVNDLMAAWTLGGYPSANVSLLNNYQKGFDYEQWLKDIYLSSANEVKEAVSYFSLGFQYFPFDINTLYFSSLHLGPLNPYFEEKSGFHASMVTFPYDDVDSWLDKNNENSVIQDFQKLLSYWTKGLEKIEKIENNPLNNELKHIAKAIYINISSFLNQYLFYRKKMDKDVFIQEELQNVKNLYEIAAKESTVGFEASNHYLYTQNMFLEKILSLTLKR